MGRKVPVLLQDAARDSFVQYSIHAEVYHLDGLLTPSLLTASADKSRFVETRRKVQRETHHCPLSLV